MSLNKNEMNNNKLENKVIELQNQSLQNYKKIIKLQKMINVLNSNKQLYIGEKGGLYYLSKKRKVYL